MNDHRSIHPTRRRGPLHHLIVAAACSFGLAACATSLPIIDSDEQSFSAGTSSPVDPAAQTPADITAPSTTAPPPPTATTIDPTVTEPSTEVEPIATTPVTVSEPLASSLDQLLERWGARNRLLAAAEGSDWLLVPVEAADLAVIETETGVIAFAGVPEDVVFAGTIDPASGEVTSVVIGYDPATAPAGPSAIFTILGDLADPSDPSFEVAFEAYEDVANGSTNRLSYSRSRNRSFLTKKTETDGGEFVQLTVTDHPDLDSARAATADIEDAIVEALTS